MPARADRSPRQVAFLHITIEGLQVSRGGVGRWANNLVAFLPELCSRWAGRGVAIAPFLAEPRLSPSTPGYDAGRLAAATESLVARGGGVRLLSNESGCEVGTGRADLPALAAAAAQVVLELIEGHEAVFVLSGESAFARLPVLVDHQIGGSAHDVRLVHTHGAAIPDGPYPLDLAELAGDAALAAWCRRSQRVRIAYISQFMREVFSRQYAVPEDRLLPNLSGIVLSDPAFGGGEQPGDAVLLAARGVPPDRPLVLTWGRNSRPGLDKGHDLLLRAAALLADAVVPVVVTPEPDPGLVRLAAELAPQAILLHGEPFATIAAVLRAPNTVAACFLSASEHGAVAPMEAAWTAGPECVLVATLTGSFPELVVDDLTGVVAQRSPSGVAAALRTVLGSSAADRRRLRAAAADRVRRCHDFKRNVGKLFDEVLGDLTGGGP